ncbi:MAG TPA: hypothetical protein V6C64_14385 [Microcoleaceae cyanobacterium]|jgi:hypothetical protein
MPGFKRKKLAITLLLALIGAGYFSTFSQVELIAPLKGYVAIIPVQIGALIYCLFYRRWSRLDKLNQIQPQQSNSEI